MSLKCKQCGKCFIESGKLRIHKRVHSSENLSNVNSVESVLVKQHT